MVKTIRIAGIAVILFLTVGMPPTFSGHCPPHSLGGKNEDVINSYQAWIPTNSLLRCTKAESEWLPSSAEIDSAAAGSGREEQKDRDNESSEPKSGVGISLGLGKLSGSTKYQIGGTVDIPSGSTHIHFPLSQLEFPLSVSMVSLGVSTPSTGPWKVEADIKKSITRHAGEAKDSDWGVYYLDGYPGAEQDTLDIYSESKAALDALIIDMDLVYRLSRKAGWSVSGKLGYRYQNFDYELSDLDQWYPSYYYYFGKDAGHDYVSGKVATYNVIYHMPYVELATEFDLNHTFSIEAGLGYSPLAYVTDEDHHILRNLVFKGELYGHAVMISLDARYTVTNDWFLAIHYSKTAVDADGESKAYYYGYIYDHTIDQTIETEQTYTSLSIGYIF